jgi:hypothetical protein
MVRQPPHENERRKANNDRSDNANDLSDGPRLVQSGGTELGLPSA